MKGKFVCVGAVLAILFAVCGVASAQVPGQLKLRGEINDYTPVTNGGPWEMHGEWSLHVLKQVEGQPQYADFSAELDMERSDYGVMVNGTNDFSDPAGRHAHTHHIAVVNGTVTTISGGFRVTGVATIAGNGNPPPDFDKLANVTIDITGASLVQYSNMKLTFLGSPDSPPAHNATAVSHFGQYPLNGVVKSVD